jgi:hypothetical protein
MGQESNLMQNYMRNLEEELSFVDETGRSLYPLSCAHPASVSSKHKKSA